jgi:hypothetical protein
MEPVIVEGFNIVIEPVEVRRLLGSKSASGREPAARGGEQGAGVGAPGVAGGRPGGGAPAAGAAEHGPRVEQALSEALEAASSLVAPRGIYIYAAGSELPGSHIFTHLARMAFCVCTIGPRLEDEVARLTQRDELLRALVLDTVGSVAAEATADHIDRAIASAAEREGLRTSCRASPGYGDWDVSEQEALFALVPAARIGVRLSPSCMMIPRKSISFAVHIAREPEMLRSSNSCENCDRGDCPYREDDR